MAYYEITNFGPGLDSRRSELTSKPGTLETLNNAFINQGGECQKRLAFVPIYLPSGTGYSFGNQPLVNGLQVFGSASAPAGFPVSFTNPAGSQSVSYQELTSPNTASPNMLGVVSSTLFNNESWVIAEFADSVFYCFFDGSLVTDFTNGLVTSWQGTSNQIASAIATMINNTGLSTNPVTGEPIYTATVADNIVEVFSTPSNASSQPFTASVTTTLEGGSTGTIVANPVTQGSATTAAVQAVGSFAIIAGTAASGFATGSVTINNTTTSSGTGSAVVIGGTVYLMVTAAYLTAHPNFGGIVSIGSPASTSTFATNLAACINGTGTPGTQYGIGTPTNTSVSALVSTNTVDLTALTSGTSGNSVTLSKIDSNSTFTLSGATLSGGTNSSYISSVNVDLAGTPTNILSAEIPWDQTPVQTAIDTAANINANAGSNGGFTASANNGVVMIYSPAANAANYNGDAVSVVVVGQLITQNISFIIDAIANTNNVSSITVNSGSNLLSGTVTSSGADPYAFGQAIATNANAHQATYILLAVGSTNNPTTVYISPLTASSATSLGGTNSTIVTYTGGTITATATPGLAVVLTSYSIAGSSKASHHAGFLTNSVTAQPSGGIPPYTYKWTYAGTGNSQLICQYPTSATTGWFTQVQGTNQTEPWICTVKDSASNSVVSSAVTIFF
jgi:hypothetical protein